MRVAKTTIQLLLKKGGRNVDINFYVKGKNKDELSIAFCKWVLPKNKIMKLIDAISNADKYDSKFKFLVNKLILLKPMAILFKKFLVEKNFFINSQVTNCHSIY